MGIALMGRQQRYCREVAMVYSEAIQYEGVITGSQENSG